MITVGGDPGIWICFAVLVYVWPGQFWGVYQTGTVVARLWNDRHSSMEKGVPPWASQRALGSPPAFTLTPHRLGEHCTLEISPQPRSDLCPCMLLRAPVFELNQE